MPYVNVPNDLSKVKTKMALNLTKRQLICFGCAAAVGLPVSYTHLFRCTALEIVSTYNSELRGICNYYSIALSLIHISDFFHKMSDVLELQLGDDEVYAAVIAPEIELTITPLANVRSRCV